MSKSFLASVLAWVLCVAALAQQPQSPVADLPDDILFIAFFMHVNTGVKLGRQTGTDVTGNEFKKIGLTSGEINLLKEIAESSQSELLSFRNKVTGPTIAAERVKAAAAAAAGNPAASSLVRAGETT